eukprot:tig00000042_g15647.t1
MGGDRSSDAQSERRDDGRASGCAGADSDKDRSDKGSWNPEDSKVLEARANKTGWLYEPPPVVEKKEPRPEDAIPDLPENAKAREFLAKAPTKGLWMPLGVEVKVMQCWRCKAYGHRTGDKDCPLFLSGGKAEDLLKAAGDPMAGYVQNDKVKEAVEERKKQLQSLLEMEERERKEKKAKKKEKKRLKKEEKKRRKEEKRKRRKEEKEKGESSSSKKKRKSGSSSSSSSSSSESESDSGSDDERRHSKKKKKKDRHKD